MTPTRRVPQVGLLLIFAACSLETIPVDDTAGTTTSPSGESSGESGSATTESPTDESESEDEDDGPLPGIVPPFDDGPSSDCDPFAQDCPDGEKCVPYSSMIGSLDDNKCVPILGDDQPGEACTWDGLVEATDTCGADSYCWEIQEVDGDFVGTCRAFCQGTADAPICAEGSSCFISHQAVITVCIPTCDPVVPECPEGLTCSWFNEGFNCIFTGEVATELGDPCDLVSCGSGLTCVTAEVLPECSAWACCAQWCSLSAPVCDWEGTECVDFFEGEALADYEDLGVCIVPEP